MPSVISERYIAEVKKDMAALNVREATTHPKATEEIPDMIGDGKDSYREGIRLRGEWNRILQNQKVQGLRQAVQEEYR